MRPQPAGQQTPESQPAPGVESAPAAQAPGGQSAPAGQALPGSGGQTLPLTGADIAGLAVLAAVLIGVGALLVSVARRREAASLRR